MLYLNLASHSHRLVVQMEIYHFVLILSIAHLFLVADSMGSNAVSTFNVMDFGAVGDGNADDTEAFMKAWESTCTSTSSASTLIVPENKIFLVKQAIFEGPCKSSQIIFQMEGKIIAPDSPEAWNDIDSEKWLQFEHVNGLTVQGSGQINGQGSNWWKRSCKYNHNKGCTTSAPTSMRFVACNDLQVTNITSLDSAQMHFLILNCQRVGVNNLNIVAPGSSPNTDGIHIQGSQHVRIEDTNIGTGDDCISIGDTVYDIIIRRINCGPGHGISIGSLGEGGAEASVEEVHVEYANFSSTTNGARIKTWQGGKGYARGISFEHCTFDNVQNPIIVDQYYCDKLQGKCQNLPGNVAISNVTYTDFQGTSKDTYAVSMNCSQAVACTEMQFNTVNLTLVTASNEDVKAYCINAYGTTTGFMQPDLTCLGH